jgi:hypothetical protein
LLKHLAAILVLKKGAAAMMDIHQTIKLWAALSPRLVRDQSAAQQLQEEGRENEEDGDEAGESKQPDVTLPLHDISSDSDDGFGPDFSSKSIEGPTCL